MSKILIVEDDSEKLRNVEEAIRSVASKGCEIYIASSLMEAKQNLKERQFDLLILDLVLPDRKGAPPEQLGVSLLEELTVSRTLKRPSFVIGLTAYPEAAAAFEQAFSHALWWVIAYDPGSNAWRKQLQNKVAYLENRATEQAARPEYEFDVACLTALHSPELQMVQQIGVDWVSQSVPGDSTEYLTGTVQTQTKALKIVAASCHQMGMPPAAILAAKLTHHFRPRFLAMTGIAAGIRGKANYGDILIADQSWDYNSGKLAVGDDGKDYFMPDPQSIPIESTLKEMFVRLVSSRKYLDEIQDRWQGEKPTPKLQAHIGPILSGSAVIENDALVARLKDQSRKLIGVEMETYSVFYASKNLPKPRPIAFSIKSVCDFADPTKDDRYQKYAAFTSAEYFFRIVKYELSALSHSL